MRDLALAVCALLAFLVPVGGYCFILAIINRREKPFVIRGPIDTIGLLCAGAGFFLVTTPMLLTDLHFRLSGDIGTFGEFLNAPMRHWLLWLAYFLCLASGAIWMLIWRWHKTMIYNVATDQFSDIFAKTLSDAGLVGVHEQGRLTIGPPPPQVDDTGFTAQPLHIVQFAVDRARRGELRIELFPAMCHVTLHWDNTPQELRRQIEMDLDKALEASAPEDNPAAGWFLSVSGLVFGALFMIVVLVLIVVVFPK